MDKMGRQLYARDMTEAAGSAPLHCRIAADIIRRANAPGRDPNLPLPSESEIRREYGVLRATARQAITELRKTGVIITIPTAGSFLAHIEPALDTPR